LVSEYANENLTDALKAEIVDRWNTTVMKRHQLVLLLESKELEEDVEAKVSTLRYAQRGGLESLP
jgi:hypothetical protein